MKNGKINFIIIWAFSVVGNTPVLQTGDAEFDSQKVHHRGVPESG